jgi:hypothetical protein
MWGLKFAKRNAKILESGTRVSKQTEARSTDRVDLMEQNRFEYYDSQIESYEFDFGEFLKEYAGSFALYLKVNYPDKLGNLVGMELGGPGIRFFEGLDWSRNIFRRTVGITLQILKEHIHKPGNHDLVEADVFLNKRNAILSWRKILEWVKQNGRPDFIIQRMVGPLFIIRSPRLFILFLERWYRILNDEGTMFIEIPDKVFALATQPTVLELIQVIRDQNKDTLEVQFADIPDRPAKALFIKKKKGAPETFKQFKF